METAMSWMDLRALLRLEPQALQTNCGDQGGRLKVAEAV